MAVARKSGTRSANSTLGGEKLRLRVGSGRAMDRLPWVSKCDAPSTQKTKSSPRSPRGRLRGCAPRSKRFRRASAKRVCAKAIFEKYNLLGGFAQDCTKPPKAVENWYDVNRLIDANHVQRDLMESPTTRKSVTIIDNAMETTPNRIFADPNTGRQPPEGMAVGNRPNGAVGVAACRPARNFRRENGLEREWICRGFTGAVRPASSPRLAATRPHRRRSWCRTETAAHGSTSREPITRSGKSETTEASSPRLAAT